MKTRVLKNIMKLVVTFSMMLSILFLGIPVRAQSQVDQSFIKDYSNMGGLIPSGCQYGAQTFTAGVTGTLTGVNIAMSKYGGSGPLRVAIRANLTGDDLAYQLVPPEDQSGSWRTFLEYMVTFTPGVPVVAGVRYAIVVSYPEGGSGYINGASFTSPQYAGGDAWGGECSPGGFWDRYWFGDYFFRTYVSTVLSINIDIKPGSYPNSINLSSAGVIPVAILGSDTFDVAFVNPDTISLAGATIKVVGKGNKLLCHIEDVNADGYPDLVCQVENQTLFLTEEGETIAVLEAETYGGQKIRGEDSVRIVKDQ